MAVSLVKRNARFLYRLARTRSDRMRQELLQHATRGQLQTIQEICYNILKFRVPLKHGQKRRLSTHARLIRELATPRSERRMRLLLQSDRTRTVFNSLLLPVLTQVVG